MPREYTIPECPVPLTLVQIAKFYGQKSIPPRLIAKRVGHGVSANLVANKLSGLRKSGVDIPTFRGAVHMTVSDAKRWRAAGLEP